MSTAPQTPSSSKKLHYAWVIVFSGMLTLFCCMGLGRFALGMLLPSMGESLQLSYSEMGFIGTGNFIGYLVSVFLCGKMITRLGERKTIVTGLILISVSMLIVSLSEQLWLIILMYFITGIGSGAANITAMTLVAHWFTQKYRGRAAGYMIVGNGSGIMASGLLIPWLNSEWADIGWRIGWAAFAIVIALLTVFIGLLIRNKPQQLSIEPLGTDPADSTINAAAHPMSDKPSRLIAHIGAIYFVFGFTYVIYATFIVTTLVTEYGFSEAKAGLLWTAIGVLSVFSGALFGWVSDHFGRKTGLITVYSIQTVSYLLVALSPGEFGLLLSMFLFGLTAFSIPAIIAALVSDMLPATEAGKVFGYVTFFFGVGQIAGPTLAGYMAELSGTFASGYLLAALLTLSGIVLTSFLKYKSSTQA
ncbi:YbfB/YjiJ family MFS transporter [Amphritea sp.]|uniref:YbfB/YjiJ family MFS transporter n=1 Tax=Amphritea sp. TaxID=1872502 RepID=UPI0025C5D0E0|nr:YbfB/YjiJ family MFS transporter [Amphritea sp.]